MQRVIILAVLCLSLAVTPALAATQTYVVFFQSWSAAFDQLALKVLLHAAAAAKTDPSAAITVTSAADTIGSHQANIYLSETRAQVVTDALTTAGISPSRIHQVALGATGTPDTSEQFERRVVITITP